MAVGLLTYPTGLAGLPPHTLLTVRALMPPRSLNRFVRALSYRLGSQPHAQQELPEGKLLSRQIAPRWTKSGPNPQSTLTIRLLNGSVTFCNRF